MFAALRNRRRAGGARRRRTGSTGTASTRPSCPSSRTTTGTCRRSRSRSTARRCTPGSTPAATRSRSRTPTTSSRWGRFSGTFAGVYGRVEEVRLGPVTVSAVPVMTAGFERPVIGTGFLSRFLPTIDYPGGRLVLRPRDGEPGDGVGVPFRIAATHLMLVDGVLNDAPMTFLVDSGLRDEHGAAFTAPAATLAAAGIALPATAPERGSTGAGDVTLELGRFPIRAARRRVAGAGGPRRPLRRLPARARGGSTGWSATASCGAIAGRSTSRG